MVNLIASPNRVLQFGYEGEDNVTQIIFNYDESWLSYGDGEFKVRVLRPGDKEAYNATDVVDNRSLMTLVMTVTDIELSRKGRGELQLVYICHDVVKKSEIYTFVVRRAIDSEVVNPPKGSIIAEVEESLSEIKDEIGNLDDLSTTNKTDLITAINEVNEKASRVSDVQVNGTSVVSDGVAEIPKANGINVYGVVRQEGDHGVNINSSGQVSISGAALVHIKSSSHSYRPITPTHQHESTFYGLAKAAGDTTQSASSNAVGTYTEEAKASICELLGIPYEKRIFRDDTFGNVWTEYRPVDVDLENNAIVLEDTTGIPTEEITPLYSAHLVYKPLLNLQYGNLPKELLGSSRIKCIGDNKIQFFKSNEDLVTFTDTGYLDMSRCRLLFMPNKTTETLPLVDNLLPDHKYRIRFKYYGYAPAATGIAINAGRYGSSYDDAAAHKRTRAIIMGGNDTLSCADYDTYGTVVGLRALAYPLQNQADSTYGELNLWVEPDDLLTGVRYYAELITMAADTRNSKNWMQPRFSFGRGFIDVPMEKVYLSKNNVNERFSNGCVFEVFDCGTHF